MATILVVNADRTTRDHICGMLAAEGYSVITASDGLEALVCLKTVFVDLILSGLSMPRMDGIALCMRVRADAHYRHVPIIITSFAADRHAFPTGLASGFLEQPLLAPTLYSRIQQLL